MFNSAAQLNDFLLDMVRYITDGNSEIRCRRVIDYLMLVGNHENLRYVTTITNDGFGYNVLFCSRKNDYSDLKVLLNTSAVKLENIIPEISKRISEICYPLNRDKSYYTERLELSLSDNELAKSGGSYENRTENQFSRNQRAAS